MSDMAKCRCPLLRHLANIFPFDAKSNNISSYDGRSWESAGYVYAADPLRAREGNCLSRSDCFPCCFLCFLLDGRRNGQSLSFRNREQIDRSRQGQGRRTPEMGREGSTRQWVSSKRVSARFLRLVWSSFQLV